MSNLKTHSQDNHDFPAPAYASDLEYLRDHLRRGTTFSDADLININNIALEASQDLEPILSTMEFFWSALSQMSKEREVIAEYIAAASSVRELHKKLAPELWCEVFKHLKPTEDFLAARAVCKSWNVIIDSSKSLWTNLKLDRVLKRCTYGPSDTVSFFFSKSSPLPLELDIQFPRSVKDNILRPLLRRVGARLTRLSVEFTGCDSSESDEYSPVQLPMLEELRLVLSDSEQLTLFTDLPRLKTLVLGNINCACWPLDSDCWNNLETIKLVHSEASNVLLEMTHRNTKTRLELIECQFRSNDLEGYDIGAFPGLTSLKKFWVKIDQKV